MRTSKNLIIASVPAFAGFWLLAAGRSGPNGGDDLVVFQSGQVAIAAEVNGNFSKVMTAADDAAAMAQTALEAANGAAAQASTLAGAISVSSGNVGIGTVSPTSTLDVAGQTRTSTLQIPSGAQNGFVLTSDSSGNASWQSAPSSGLNGSGTAGFLPRFIGGTALGNSVVSQDGAGNVGIGTAMPKAQLHVGGDNGLVATGTRGMGTIPIEGPGERMMWYPTAAAFRAGTVDGSQWNSANIGAASIALGRNNTARGNYTTVGGGSDNTAEFLGPFATIGGGRYNSTSGGNAVIGGGVSNEASGSQATIGGGEANIASGPSSTIGGGNSNAASEFNCTVSGGYNNIASGQGATVGGGNGNQAAAVSTVGGGLTNQASGAISTVGGGFSNTSSGSSSTVGGGSQNAASGQAASVCGGRTNQATGSYAAIGGGQDNTAGPMRFATVAGGYRNTASGDKATIGGGDSNRASGYYASIAGGFQNEASELGATVAGGNHNLSSAVGAAIGGGGSNAASGALAAVAGGSRNTASASYSAVGGGLLNSASAICGTIGGGLGNTASASYSTVSGGRNNAASGDFSFAAGRRAKASHAGAFVWGDSQNLDKASSVSDEFNVYASGGTRIFSNSTATTGVLLAPGAGAWSMVSDRHAKENFEPVDALEVLAKVCQLPISTWNYRDQADSIRHMGPMAQDFYAAFALGLGDRTLDTIDPDGVALAAIQGLSVVCQEQEAVIARQATALALHELQLAELRSRQAAIEAQLAELIGNQR